MWRTPPVTSCEGEIQFSSSDTCVYDLHGLVADSEITNINSRAEKQCESPHKSLCSLQLTHWL
jgi:hypothetical protein